MAKPAVWDGLSHSSGTCTASVPPGATRPRRVGRSRSWSGNQCRAALVKTTSAGRGGS